jgi:FtsH-binding integral membrane protein
MFSRLTDLDATRSVRTARSLNFPEGTAGSELQKDAMLRRYVKEVSLCTSKLLGITAFSGIASFGALTWFANSSFYSGRTPGLLGGIWLGASLGYLYHAWNVGSPGKTADDRRSHAYWMHCLLGISIVPALLKYKNAIPSASAVTFSLVAGPITAALLLPKGKLLSWGNALYTGLWGIAGISAAAAIGRIFGWHQFGDAAHSLELYGGVALFTMFNAFDTHKVISDYNNGVVDVIGHATNYTLNAVNIFIRLLEIFGDTDDSEVHNSRRTKKQQ